MFRSFDEFNEKLTTILGAEASAILSRSLSRAKTMRSALRELPISYTNAYNKVQVLQYDSDGNVEDATPENQLTVPESVITQAKDAISNYRSYYASDKALFTALGLEVNPQINTTSTSISVDPYGVLPIDGGYITLNYGVPIGFTPCYCQSSKAIGYASGYYQKSEDSDSADRVQGLWVSRTCNSIGPIYFLVPFTYNPESHTSTPSPNDFYKGSNCYVFETIGNGIIKFYSLSSSEEEQTSIEDSVDVTNFEVTSGESNYDGYSWNIRISYDMAIVCTLYYNKVLYPSNTGSGEYPAEIYQNIFLADSAISGWETSYPPKLLSAGSESNTENSEVHDISVNSDLSSLFDEIINTSDEKMEAIDETL